MMSTDPPVETETSETPELNSARESAESVAQGQEDNQASNDESAAGESADQGKSKILIGSQRDVAAVRGRRSRGRPVRKSGGEPPAAVAEETAAATPSKRQPVKASPHPPAKTAVPPPIEDVEAEIEQALKDISLQQLMNEEEVGQELELDSRVKGTVSRLHGENVFFTLKGRFEGIASLKHFKKPPHPGAMMDVIVAAFNEDEGLYELAIPGASVHVEDWADLTEGALVEARITGSNTGGLECVVHNIRGFIPASQIELFRVENFAEYINHKLACVVTEVNARKKKLVLSHRAVVERQQQQQREELLQSIHPGDTRQGVVTKLMDFGALVDLGGIEGLVHISKLSWERVEHPKEVLQVGQKITVKVEKVRAAAGKISLSYRDTLEHPWHGIEDKFAVNSLVSGQVTRIAQFGAFVRLCPGVEGLIHISELAHYRVLAVKNVVNEGDEVEVKILSIDPEKQKIALSLKATQPKPEPQKADKPAEAQPPLRPLAVPKHKDPLKGGTDRSAGGDQFGLKW